jgi:hypothetical protein
VTVNPYEELFAKHHSKSVPSLWEWQEEVLEQYASTDGDVAVELPTGAGKTLIGLLAAEQHRLETGEPVAFLAGNKQLAQQVERQAREQKFQVVRFEDPKQEWDRAAVRSFNFGNAIGIMNYWNYFNSSPGVVPAGMVILDDVHLLEGRLREMFTVSLPKSDALFKQLLRRIVERCPYYTGAEDLLNDIASQQPPEMLAFPDSADLAGEVRDLLDATLVEGTDRWWAWRDIRSQLEICCWMISGRAVTFTPYIPPSQTLEHFSEPSHRLYLSATLGTEDDLRRRLGAPSLTKLGASVEPKQGRRMVVIRDGIETPEEDELLEELRGILEQQKKALWLCARKETALRFQMALVFSGLKGQVRILEGDNGEDEPFTEEPEGHLIAAGRYDGMDFPDEACRVEIVPEVPVATSDLEEFVSSYLRDAPFAEARFGQRVAQALGRCNRSEDDRAVYLLTDPEFLGRFSQPRALDALPDHVREDIYAGLVRADGGFAFGLKDAERFLDGEEIEQELPPPRREGSDLPPTAGEEIEGYLALWAGDYEGAAADFDRVAAQASTAREYRGFWLALRALALKRSADLGDPTSGRQAKGALKAAVAAGGRNTFFTRLRLSEARLEGGVEEQGDGSDALFAAWDRLMDRLGTAGPRFDNWCEQLLDQLSSSDHDTVARAITRVGSELLGLSAGAPQATQGEEDSYWELNDPRRTLSFEVKLAPKKKRVVNDDVEQAEGATRAAETNRGNPVRGILVTPHSEADDTAEARLERVRLMRLGVLVEQVELIFTALRTYRRGWSEDSAARGEVRNAAVAQLPPIDWLWQASTSLRLGSAARISPLFDLQGRVQVRPALPMGILSSTPTSELRRPRCTGCQSSRPASTQSDTRRACSRSASATAASTSTSTCPRSS